MRVAVFHTHRHEREAIEESSSGLGHELIFHRGRLAPASIGRGTQAVCSLWQEQLHADDFSALEGRGVAAVALRRAAFAQGLSAARHTGLELLPLSDCAPIADAQHLLNLLMQLHADSSGQGRKGSSLAGKTVGLIGESPSFAVLARALAGHGCELLLHRPPFVGEGMAGCIRHASVDEILTRSHLVSLYAPEGAAPWRLDEAALGKLRKGAAVLASGPGVVIDGAALLEALTRRRLAAAVIDLHERPEGGFHEPTLSSPGGADLLIRLGGVPNLLVTAHPSLLSREAVERLGAELFLAIDCLGRRKLAAA